MDRRFFRGACVDKNKRGKKIPIQEDIHIRFDLFFEPGTFEINTMWDERKNNIEMCIIHRL